MVAELSPSVLKALGMVREARARLSQQAKGSAKRGCAMEVEELLRSD